MEAFKFDDYREYLRNSIETKGYNYEQFVQKVKQVVGVDTVKRLLARQGGQGDFRRSHSISNEKLAEILSEMRVSKSESLYLLVIKLANDSPRDKDGRPGRFSKMMLELARELKTTENTVKPRTSSESDPFNAAISLLPAKARNSFLARVIPILGNTLERYPEVIGANKALKELVDLKRKLDNQ